MPIIYSGSDTKPAPHPLAALHAFPLLGHRCQGNVQHTLWCAAIKKSNPFAKVSLSQGPKPWCEPFLKGHLDARTFHNPFAKAELTCRCATLFQGNFLQSSALIFNASSLLMLSFSKASLIFSMISIYCLLIVAVTSTMSFCFSPEALVPQRYALSFFWVLSCRFCAMPQCSLLQLQAF